MDISCIYLPLCLEDRALHSHSEFLRVCLGAGGVNEEAARAQQERRKERIRASQHASTTGRGDERGSGRGASDRDRHHSSSSSHDRCLIPTGRHTVFTLYVWVQHYAYSASPRKYSWFEKHV